MAKTQTSWKKGQSGNPNGRPPKGYSITEWFREMLASEPDKKKAMAEAILNKATEGDISAARLIWSYVDGLPAQSKEADPADKVEEVTVKIVDNTTKKLEEVLAKIRAVDNSGDYGQLKEILEECRDEELSTTQRD